MALVVEGYREKQIAQRIDRGQNTVYTHAYRARVKLGATTLAQAAVLFFRARKPKDVL